MNHELYNSLINILAVAALAVGMFECVYLAVVPSPVRLRRKR